MDEEKMEELKRRIAKLETDLHSVFCLLEMQIDWNVNQSIINKEIYRMFLGGKHDDHYN